MGWVKAAGYAVTALSALSGQKAKGAANDQASQVQLEARVRAANIRKLARRTQGQATADTSASGVVVDEGSPLLVQADISRQAELDAFYSILSGDAEAHSIRRRGSASATGSLLGAAGTALSIYGQGD